MGDRSDNLGSATPFERANLVKRYPAWILASALVGSDEWWGHVAEVQSGRDPADVARLYVPRAGVGRDVVAAMLVRASKAPDRDKGWQEMAPFILVFGSEPLGPSDPQRWIRGAPSGLEHDPDPPPSKRRKRDYDAWETLRSGALMVARRGACRCLSCGTPLTSEAKRTRRDYCHPHSPRREQERGYHLRAMRTVLLRAEYGTFETSAEDLS